MRNFTRHETSRVVTWSVVLSVILSSTFVASCKPRSFNASSAKEAATAPSAKLRSKLVVFVIVDQMRPDYIERFRSAFEKTVGARKGFLAFKDEGAWFANARTSGAPTVTAAGHASICTGADASRHGIVANAYWVPQGNTGRLEESASDPSVAVVRSPGLFDASGYDAKAKTPDESSSPARLRIPSFAEVLRTRTGGASRSVSVSVKDRGSVFCGGKGATGAYWLDEKTTSFGTSTYFASALPAWVDAFNAKHRPALELPWAPTFKSVEEARGHLADELSRKGLASRSALSTFLGTAFPYVAKAPGDDDALARKRFAYLPAASDLIATFALEALKAEDLGRRASPGRPDFLSLSFSSPDYVGHQFGSDSFELFDTYVKLNATLERFRQGVEAHAGAENVLWVLTADHGAQRMPEVTGLAGGAAGRIDTKALLQTLRTKLEAEFKAPDLVDAFSTDQVYLNEASLKRGGWDRNKVIETIRATLSAHEGVLTTLTREDIENAPEKEGNLEASPASFYKRGYDKERSGHVFMVVKKGWLGDATLAGTHGTVYEDDARIPFVFSGAGIRSQVVSDDVRANDIAPTVLALMGLAPGEEMNGKDRSNAVAP